MVADSYSHPPFVSVAEVVRVPSPECLLGIGANMGGNAICTELYREVRPASVNLAMVIPDVAQCFALPYVLVIIAPLPAQQTHGGFGFVESLDTVLSPVPSCGKGQHVPLAAWFTSCFYPLGP